MDKSQNPGFDENVCSLNPLGESNVLIPWQSRKGRNRLLSGNAPHRNVFLEIGDELVNGLSAFVLHQDFMGQIAA